MQQQLQQAGVPATNLTVLPDSVRAIVPIMTSKTPKGQLIGALLAAFAVIGFFAFSMVWLELEKRRACQPYRPSTSEYEQVVLEVLLLHQPESLRPTLPALLCHLLTTAVGCSTFAVAAGRQPFQLHKP